MEPCPNVTVAIPLLSDALPVSIVGPAHLLRCMGKTGPTLPNECGSGPFVVRLLSADGMPVEYGSAVIRCDGKIGEASPPDLVYLPGPERDFEEAVRRNGPFIDWIRDCHARGSVVAAACTGALFLAEAGLLDGRRATTHWCHAQFFQSRYPEVRWEIPRLLVEDGRVITAGGATAYLNLMIHLAEKFLGRERALLAARFMLVDPERDSQLPYLIRSDGPSHGDRVVRKAQDLLSADPGKPIPLVQLALACGVSPRTLLRRFRTALGETPGKYRQGLRIERAKRLLENTDRTVEEIVAEVGYDDSRSFRRLFLQQVGISPKRYRRKYAVSPAGREREGAAAFTASSRAADLALRGRPR